MATYIDGSNKTFHEQLTQLLMDNGAAVTKQSIDKLMEFITQRDQSIISEVIRQAERLTAELQRQTNP
jgi:ABC-type transporter Mla subunit MlaD